MHRTNRDFRNTSERTIEGDLFSAFVAAGAISKANANDPKKSQLVRCARTDKGVHAAGNVISLKLIIENEDIVQKINSHLSPQIRVYGIQRTTSSFSSYQACDSRRYEYLIPTHAFLPPHPSSWLAKKLGEIADEAMDRKAYDERRKEVADFWDNTEDEHIKPILRELDQEIKDDVYKALYEVDLDQDSPHYNSEEVMRELVEGDDEEIEPQDRDAKPKDKDGEQLKRLDSGIELSEESTTDVEAAKPKVISDNLNVEAKTDKTSNAAPPEQTQAQAANADNSSDNNTSPSVLRKRKLDTALRTLRRAYQSSKRTYRIHPQRLARVQPILNEFLGTKNFHNYTIQKPFHDPSAKRLIKSFEVNQTPIVINGTEWLSIKIHGQSFMMHQIRKMIAMVALVVRCGCDPARIQETFTNVAASIPKAPALGLLLERPVFDSYNKGPAMKFDRAAIDFAKYEAAVEEFKHREIYQRQFQEEEEGNQFHQFFSHTDNLRDPQLLYLSSMGFEAVERERKRVEEEKREQAAEVDGVESKIKGGASREDQKD